MTQVFRDPFQPVPYLEEVWKNNQADVDRLKLRYVQSGMMVIGQSWFVPLVVDDNDVDAYELVRVIDNLQDQVERASGLDVTLTLDPRAQAA